MANNSVVNENVQPIISEESQLSEEYEQLVLKYHKQQLILSAMKNIDSSGFKELDESSRKNIDTALDFVRAFDYLKMDNAGNNVLGNTWNENWPMIKINQYIEL